MMLFGEGACGVVATSNKNMRNMVGPKELYWLLPSPLDGAVDLSLKVLFSI